MNTENYNEGQSTMVCLPSIIGLLSLVALLFSSSQVSAQLPDHISPDILLLRDANLVIVLKTNQKSYTQKRNAAKNAGRTKEVERLDFAREQLASFHQQFTISMRTSFNFAHPYFIYDYDLRDHLAGKTGLLLNDSLMYDDQLSVSQERPTYYAKEAFTGDNGDNRIFSYVIYDPERPSHRYGLPTVAVNQIGPLSLLSEIGGAGSTYRPAKKIVKRWNSRMLRHERIAKEYLGSN